METQKRRRAHGIRQRSNKNTDVAIVRRESEREIYSMPGKEWGREGGREKKEKSVLSPRLS